MSMKSNVKYGDIQIKQHSKVKYLVCILYEAMTLSVVDKINNKLKFHHQKNRFPTLSLT